MTNKHKTMFSISTPIISNLLMEEREKTEGSHKQVEKKGNFFMNIFWDPFLHNCYLNLSVTKRVGCDDPHSKSEESL